MKLSRIWCCSLWAFVLIKIMAFSDILVMTEQTGDLVSTTVVDAVVNKEARLPCDIEPDTNEDRVYMVLWFRDAGGKPLYSFDVRGRSFNKALHWSDPLAFGERATFVSISQPAALIVNTTELDDEGIYRCRVDFKNSPTRNFQIKLNVIVPPHQMLLYDEAGRDVAGVIGPLKEGGNFTLLCELRGGRPQPTLRWLMNRTMIEDHTIVKKDGAVVVSKIHLTGAKRDWLNTTIRCQANNTHLISPHERSAKIEMNLRPITVEILKKPTKMVEGENVSLTCVTRGSRPPAEIKWFRGNRRYRHGEQKDYTNETTTVSHLRFEPTPYDHNVSLKCRADNVLLGVSIDDIFVMHVVYYPVVNLSLGSTLQPNEIKEGDDVYFECNIKANPKENRISWYHNGGHIKGSSSGIYISAKSLVLQKVDRTHGGLYSCVAANEIGETSSPELYLRVQFAPVCSQPTPMLIGARIDEQLRIRCTVRADPADVNFTWLFNNSGESFEVSPHRYGPNFMVSQGGTASELRYQASSERDYGTLTCLTKNTVGDQNKPCIFQVVPAARPSPPRNCTVLKVPRHVEPLLAIRCLAGYDGGTRQHFTLETTGHPSQLLVNTTTGYHQAFSSVIQSEEYVGVSDPYFLDLVVWLNVTWSTLEDIPEGHELMITARNSKGPSEPIVLHGLIFRDPVKKIDVGVADETKVPIAVTLIALTAVLACACAVAAYVCRKRPDITSATTVPNKRPSQSVVQVDSQGRKYMFTYPDTSDKDSKPDILLPKTDNAPPRVVLESSGDSYLIREVRPVLPPLRPEQVI